MSTREEIREGMWQILRREGHHVMEADRALDEMMQYLHSQGVVIRVDKEWCEDADHFCVATEPLAKI